MPKKKKRAMEFGDHQRFLISRAKLNYFERILNNIKNLRAYQIMSLSRSRSQPPLPNRQFFYQTNKLYIVCIKNYIDKI